MKKVSIIPGDSKEDELHINGVECISEDEPYVTLDQRVAGHIIGATRRILLTEQKLRENQFNNSEREKFRAEMQWYKETMPERWSKIEDLDLVLAIFRKDRAQGLLSDVDENAMIQALTPPAHLRAKYSAGTKIKAVGENSDPK